MRSAGFISFCTDVVVDILQITKVSCILQSIAGCCSNRSTVTICILGTIESTLDVRDLVTTDIDITASDSSRAIGAKGNLSAGGLAAFGLLVADGRDTRQIFCQLDFQLSIRCAVDADVAFCQVALRTTDDIESVVQLLGNFFSIIALEFQAVFQCSYLVFTSLVFIDDTGQARSIDALLAIDSILAIFSSFVIAVLDGDIDRSTILAVRPGRACQADMADTIFTRNGDSIFAILAGDTDFAVDTIFTGFTFRAANGDTIFARFTIFTIQTADGDAVGAVQADMAIPAVDANLTIFTVFARLADTDVLGQLQIIRDLAIFIRGFMEQDVLASIDVFFRLFILTFTS